MKKEKAAYDILKSQKILNSFIKFMKIRINLIFVRN